MDHPRSRGVYCCALCIIEAWKGSSPLARGLQGDEGGWPKPGRIIPARAGFTGDPLPGGLPRGDHPRSRGVYWLNPFKAGPTNWIIPARAGFTDAAGAGADHAEDHPRSRGVYSVISTGLSAGCGSSPLARGLRRLGGGPDRCARIIPARAGFTPRSPGPRAGMTDHPRSRGVYGGWSGNVVVGVGSSPLARGLHGVAQAEEANRRIIPARAGFTRRPCVRRRRGQDHPRSRGVYGVAEEYGHRR